MEWILENKEWVFSGFGFGIVSITIGFLVNRNNKSTQTITSGDNSTNIQGRDNVHVNLGDSNDR